MIKRGKTLALTFSCEVFTLSSTTACAIDLTIVFIFLKQIDKSQVSRLALFTIALRRVIAPCRCRCVRCFFARAECAATCPRVANFRKNHYADAGGDVGAGSNEFAEMTWIRF
ncbi:MAG: hypothetical protein H7335_14055 [Massilia sp.]|nr:hypothetical protein [Massilia sp.]